jgi:hypothetical protein
MELQNRTQVVQDSANEGEWIVKKNKSKKKQDQLGKVNRFGMIWEELNLK